MTQLQTSSRATRCEPGRKPEEGHDLPNLSRFHLQASLKTMIDLLILLLKKVGGATLEKKTMRTFSFKITPKSIVAVIVKQARLGKVQARVVLFIPAVG